MISNIFNNKELPIYAKGENSREWIHVLDHYRSYSPYLKGKPGESYNVVWQVEKYCFSKKY